MVGLGERVGPRLWVARRESEVVRVAVTVVEVVEEREVEEQGEGVRVGTRDTLGAPLPV